MTSTPDADPFPAATLTDNTSRFTHGHNDFERLLASLGITQKSGHPNHPQIQGKVERFHQTLKRWLSARPRPATLIELQNLLDTFRAIYNTNASTAPCPRPPHPNRPTSPDPKPTPPTNPTPTSASATTPSTDSAKLTLRHGSRLHHLGIGITHAHTPVLILVASHTITVISKTSHHVLSSHTINPDKLLAQPTEKPRPMAGAICHP